MITVCLNPPNHLSQAMFRVARALEHYAPGSVRIVPHAVKADIEVLHVIGEEAVGYVSPAKRTVVIQYCANGVPPERWATLWKRAIFVWSYYDFTSVMPEEASFYLAPLGIDGEFRKTFHSTVRDYEILTSGYVAGNGQEAIEEPWTAAARLGYRAFHLGPEPVGLCQPPEVPPVYLRGVSDPTLAEAYRRTRRVSGLRFREGFELPVIEGFACGCRPVVFDRPETRLWFGDFAEFVPEVAGKDLVEILRDLFSRSPEPVSSEERARVLAKFDWETIADGFWDRILREMNE